MDNFTPWSALGGGAILGAAAVALYAFNGRVAGISSILGGALLPVQEVDASDERAWRWWFLAGLVAGAAVLHAARSDALAVSDASLGAVALSGLLVGVGTTLANGCTSGHGVCGLARRSPRSLAAVLTFMGVAMVAVFVLRHVGGRT
jgi:uncharacterized membrane protein YedE/YeeE